MTLDGEAGDLPIPAYVALKIGMGKVNEWSGDFSPFMSTDFPQKLGSSRCGFAVHRTVKDGITKLGSESLEPSSPMSL